MLSLKVLGSSSEGNCYLLNTSKEVLLVECGVNYKKILSALNFKLSNVSGCLISHEHQDHSKSVNDIIKAGIDVYCSQGTAGALNISGHRVHIIKSLNQFKIKEFTLLPFNTEHDSAEPLGFLIEHPEFGKLLFATDTYYIRYKFKGLTHIMLECNYSRPILYKNIEAGLINKALKNRIIQSHFSLENVKEFLKANDLSKVESIILMHLSNGNSDARGFKSEIEKLTGVPVTIC